MLNNLLFNFQRIGLLLNDTVAHFVHNGPQNTFYDMDLQSLKMPDSNKILLSFSAHVWVPVFEIWNNFTWDKAFLNPGVDALDLIKNSKQIAKKI
jgi:hypothetical protein